MRMYQRKPQRMRLPRVRFIPPLSAADAGAEKFLDLPAPFIITVDFGAALGSQTSASVTRKRKRYPPNVVGG